jgi:lipoate-protein ligase A
MALDEALLEAMSRLGKPLLRLYGWTEPAASFGYFQKYVEVERATLLRPLVRRPTGGGIVPHDADWTYSLAFPAGSEWHSLRAVKVTVACTSGFNQRSQDSIFPPNSPRAARSHRPASASRATKVRRVVARSQNRAAQRRTRPVCWSQGSVQPPPLGLAKIDWQKAMCDAAHFDFGVQWTELNRTPCCANERRRWPATNTRCRRTIRNDEIRVCRSIYI